MKDKLDKHTISRLKVGEKTTGEGIEVRRTKKGLVFYAATQTNGKRLRERLGHDHEEMNLTKARKYLQQLILSVPESIDISVNKSNIQFSEAAEYYLTTLAQSGGKNISQKKQQLNMHLKPYFKKAKVKSFSTLQVDKYAHQGLETGAAVSTVNRELATLRHMLSQLSEWGVVETKHIRVKTKPGEKKRTLIFTKAETHKMVECAKNDHDYYTQFFILIGFQTSMRHMEILRIRFEDFDHENRVLKVHVAKAGQREVYVHDDLLKVVKEEQAKRGVTTGFLFAAESKTGHRSYMKKQFQRVVVAAGLQDRGFVPHVMRHTAVTTVMAQGLSVADAMKISGHKSAQSLLGYTHANTESVRRGVSALASITSDTQNDADGGIAA